MTWLGNSTCSVLLLLGSIQFVRNEDFILRGQIPILLARMSYLKCDATIRIHKSSHENMGERKNEKFGRVILDLERVKL